MGIGFFFVVVSGLLGAKLAGQGSDAHSICLMKFTQAEFEHSIFVLCAIRSSNASEIGRLANE